MPAGTVIDHPDAHRLVAHGCAEPADDECFAKSPYTHEQCLARANDYLKLTHCAPEDREAWDRGYMRGYNPDGSWIPGPNADELEEAEWEEYKNNSRLVLP